MLKTLTILLACIATPTLAENLSVETYRGSVEVPKNPKTIAVLDLAALDTLNALGVDAQGTVRPLFLPYLEKNVDTTAPVGSLFEPDLEALNALQPDLIIAGGRSSEQVPNLEKMAPTIDMTIWEDTIGQGMDRMNAYAAIFDKQETATALEQAIREKLEKINTLAKDNGSALIVMTNGPKISAYGAGSRFGWLHTATGIQTAVAEIENTTHGEAISFEFIRDANPDMLIVIDRLAAIGREKGAAQKTLDNALVHETNAWKSDRVIYLSSAPIYITSGGVQSLNTTLDELIAALAGQ